MPTSPATHRQRQKARLPKPKDNRPSAGQRGYGAQWRKLRAWHLSMEPLCRTCRAEGNLTLATVVDHIIPLSRGGKDAASNLQSLCVTCHNHKTDTQDGGFGRGRVL